MANEPKAKAAGPLKIAGGVLLLAGSLALMFHRMPHRQYAAVHADAPRPKSIAASPSAAPAAAQASLHPAAQQPSIVPPNPSSRRSESAKFAEATPVEIPQAEEETSDWTDDCAPESGILCHDVPAPRLARCLNGYADALMSPCRRALRRLRSRRRSVIQAKSGA